MGALPPRRRMTRHYADKPIPRPAVERILAVARSAPSAGNARGQRFTVVTDPNVKTQIAAAAGEPAHVAAGKPPWLSSAPVLIVITVSVEAYRRRYASTDKTDSTPPADWSVPYWWLDGGAALGMILLAAAAEGLDTGFLGAHAVPGLGELIGTPTDEIPAGIVTLGRAHPEGGPPGSSQRPDSASRVRWIEGHR